MCEERARRVAAVSKPADCFGHFGDTGMIRFARQTATADQKDGGRIREGAAGQFRRYRPDKCIHDLVGAGDGQRAAALEIEKHVSAATSTDGYQARTGVRIVSGAEFDRSIESPRPASVG